MLVIFTQTALSGQQPLETLDLALAAASLNQPVKLVFLAEGMTLLQEKMNQQQLSPANQHLTFGKSFLARLKALSLFGINEIFIDADYLSAHPNSKLCQELNLELTPLTKQELHQLLSSTPSFIL